MCLFRKCHILSYVCPKRITVKNRSSSDLFSGLSKCPAKQTKTLYFCFWKQTFKGLEKHSIEPLPVSLDY